MGRVKCDPDACARTHKLHYGTGMPVFKGEIRHTGYGLGSLLSGLARTVLPVISPIAKTLAKSALRTGGHILSDVVSGRESLKSSARKRIADTIEEHVNPSSSKKRRRKKNKEKISNDIFS